jgi:hypothetical protein
MNTTLISPWSQNSKLSDPKDKLNKVATTYRPVGDAGKGEGTCPGTCPHLPSKGGGCYTRKFLVNQQQKKSLARHDDLDRLTSKGARLVRLHTSGDFFTSDGNGVHALDVPYLTEVIEWCKQNPDVTVWTYTHDVRCMIAAGFSYAKGSFPENLHIVASVETPIERKIAKDNGFRTAQVIDAIADQDDNTTLCPYDLALHKGSDKKTNCAACRLCFNPKHKKDIAFLKH